jgi:hypothetical protein
MAAKLYIMRKTLPVSCLDNRKLRDYRNDPYYDELGAHAADKCWHTARLKILHGRAQAGTTDNPKKRAEMALESQNCSKRPLNRGAGCGLNTKLEHSRRQRSERKGDNDEPRNIERRRRLAPLRCSAAVAVKYWWQKPKWKMATVC